MSSEQSRAERRSIAGQQLFFCIGILINVILIVALKQAPSIGLDSTSRAAGITNLKNKTRAYYSVIQNSSGYTPLNNSANQTADQDEWLTLVIVCGNGETDTVAEMKPLLTSAILLSSAPLHFVFITEQASSDRIQIMFEDDLSYSKKPIKVDTWVLSEEAVKTFATLLDYNLASHHSGVWGTSKLMLPWILKDMDRAVSIDTDMIFLDDPARLWDEFSHTATTEEWLYKMPLHNVTHPSHICSCIVLLQLDRIRESNTFPVLMEEALLSKPEWKLQGRYKVPHGDQGLFWAMMQKNSDHIAPLPEQWNSDRCHDYFDALKPEERKPASILHNNCDFGSKNYGPAKEYFVFYEKYKWHWLKGDGAEKYPVQVTVHPAETERLQNLFKCLKEKGDKTKCKS